LGGIARALPEYKFIAYESWGEPVKFDLPNIEYRPFNENIQDFYNEIDILLIPSKSEGYCTVALEALSQGVPVVGSDIPGIREVVGDSGILGDCYACNIRKVTADHSAKSLQRFTEIQQDDAALLDWFGLNLSNSYGLP
jgi:glycosyltransferase involved in cell wall biosynthesis